MTDAALALELAIERYGLSGYESHAPFNSREATWSSPGRDRIIQA